MKFVLCDSSPFPWEPGTLFKYYTTLHKDKSTGLGYSKL